VAGYKLTEMFLDESAKGRPGKKIHPKGLVVHWTANTGRGANARANRNYFNHTDRSVSAHYVVDDKEVVQCLPEDEMAYHVGAKTYKEKAVHELSGYPNDCTIGIEICVNADGDFKKTLKNVIALAADICKRYGWCRENLWRHYDITGKDCPRFFVDEETAVLYTLSSAGGAWDRFKVDVEMAKLGEKKVTWKDEIMQKAVEKGFIDEGKHNPNDPAPKWFVLEVLMDALEKKEGRP